ncbi:MAG TPA: aminoacyl-tRNA hydrolase [candidate division Zixibacteria bacterium]|jgi:PTH1 family peptidyl-tRNA hydrolase|nr:aminoacyl-tRNA hydrolase [candidate division Zixibacteria bacterium]
MWCVVGLGNPGRRYEGTRHNLGFLAVDELARRRLAPWRARALHLAARTADGAPALLVKPQTFMNLSGPAVARALRYRKVAADRLLVVCDDLALPFGSLRLRPRGSDGGHNGLRSIIESLGTSDFPRLRLGIGAAPPGLDASRYVLERFPPAERSRLPELLGLAADGLELALEKGIEKAMNQINRTIKEEPR